jgi:hypothetical protein
MAKRERARKLIGPTRAFVADCRGCGWLEEIPQGEIASLLARNRAPSSMQWNCKKCKRAANIENVARTEFQFRLERHRRRKLPRAAGSSSSGQNRSKKTGQVTEYCPKCRTPKKVTALCPSCGWTRLAGSQPLPSRKGKRVKALKYPLSMYAVGGGGRGSIRRPISGGLPSLGKRR